MAINPGDPRFDIIIRGGQSKIAAVREVMNSLLLSNKIIIKEWPRTDNIEDHADKLAAAIACVDCVTCDYDNSGAHSGSMFHITHVLGFTTMNNHNLVWAGYRIRPAKNGWRIEYFSPWEFMYELHNRPWVQQPLIPFLLSNQNQWNHKAKDVFPT